MQADVGQRAGRFKLLEVLGTGGFASVYRAEDTQLGTQVAIKVLHAHLARDEAFVRRFYAEARAAARLRSHPHIVTIYDVGQTTDGRPYLVMGIVEGKLLAEVLKERGPLPFAEAIKILGQLCSALDYLHHAGLVHRDLKPSNVMIDNEGEVMLMDLGIARAVYESEGLTQTGQMIGTPAYMAPEQITGGDISAATDIYALGILAYEMLAGRTPFVGTPTTIIRDQVLAPPPPILTFNGSLPASAARIIEQALAKDPSGRPASAGAFIAELASGIPSTEPLDVLRIPIPPMPAPPTPDPKRFFPPAPAPSPAVPGRLLAIGGGVFGLLLVVIVSVVLIGRARAERNSDTNASRNPSPPPTSRPSPTPTPVPEPLYTRLLNSPVAASELPAGFSSPKVTTTSPDDDDRANGAVAAVEIDLTGPDFDDFVSYAFFPTDSDAKARFGLFSSEQTLQAPAGSASSIFGSGPAGTVPVPNLGNGTTTKCFTGTGTSNNKKYGFTACVVLAGNVYAFADSRVQGDSQKSGNADNTIALTRFGLAHLQRVQGSAPSAGSATPRPSSGPTPSPTPRPSATPVSSPTTTLPSSVTVTADDAASQSRVNEVKGVLAEFLGRMTQDYGAVTNRPFRVYLTNTEPAARSRLSKDFEFTATQVDGFFTTKTPTQTSMVGTDNTVEVLVYLPNVSNLRAALSFVCGSYALRTAGGGFEKTDAYPFWFLRGFEGYQQIRLANTASYRTQAAQELKASKSPSLSTIATNADASKFIASRSDASASLDVRGEVAVEYLAKKYGEGVVGRLLNGNAGSVAGFNALLTRITGLTIDQLDTAVNDYLQQ